MISNFSDLHILYINPSFDGTSIKTTIKGSQKWDLEVSINGNKIVRYISHYDEKFLVLTFYKRIKGILIVRRLSHPKNINLFNQLTLVHYDNICDAFTEIIQDYYYNNNPLNKIETSEPSSNFDEEAKSIVYNKDIYRTTSSFLYKRGVNKEIPYSEGNNPPNLYKSSIFNDIVSEFIYIISTNGKILKEQNFNNGWSSISVNNQGLDFLYSPIKKIEENNIELYRYLFNHKKKQPEVLFSIDDFQSNSATSIWGKKYYTYRVTHTQDIIFLQLTAVRNRYPEVDHDTIFKELSITLGNLRLPLGVFYKSFP